MPRAPCPLPFAFAFAFAFLAFAVGCITLARILEPAIFGLVADTPAHEATRLVSISFSLSLALVALTLLCQGTDLLVIWPFPVVWLHCHTCLILCVVFAGTEASLLSSLRRCPDFASGVGLAPMKVLCQER